MSTASLQFYGLGTIGRKWFQFRSYSPIPFFLLVLVLKPNVEWNLVEKLFIAAVVIFAEVLRIVAVGYAGSTTRTRQDHVTNLVHAGPFRWLRNPLYLANIILYTGTSLFFGFTYLTLFGLAYFTIQYTFIIAYEEQLLEQNVGNPYRNYKQAVNRWMPSPPKISSSSHQFDLKKGLTSEKSTLIAISAMVILYWIKTVYLGA